MREEGREGGRKEGREGRNQRMRERGKRGRADNIYVAHQVEVGNLQDVVGQIEQSSLRRTPRHTFVINIVINTIRATTITSTTTIPLSLSLIMNLPLPLTLPLS